MKHLLLVTELTVLSTRYYGTRGDKIYHALWAEITLTNSKLVSEIQVHDQLSGKRGLFDPSQADISNNAFSVMYPCSIIKDRLSIATQHSAIRVVALYNIKLVKSTTASDSLSGYNHNSLSGK